jgi:type VI secretion system protein VasD
MAVNNIRLTFRNNRAAGSGRYFVAVLLLVLSASFGLVACSTVKEAASKAADAALGAVGIKPPDNPDRPVPPRPVNLRIGAAKDLNAGDDGQGLSAIVRLFKLKDQNSFLAAPYSSFGHPEKERQALGTDLLEVRELIISPGQTLDLKEKLPSEAGYLGIITLFRSPHPQRWRFAFPAADAEKSGITVGVHTCAMTASSVAPVGMTINETRLLSHVRCR